MIIKDGKISDCKITISNTTKVPDSYGVQTTNNFTVDFEGCPVDALLGWVKKAWWIDDQKVIRKLSIDKVHALNGTTVSYLHAKTKFVSISEDQAKTITKASFRDYIDAGEFEKATILLREVTGNENLEVQDDGTIHDSSEDDVPEDVE